MAVLAMCLIALTIAPAPDVLSDAHGLEVPRVHAGPVAAEMVEGFRADRSPQQQVHGSVGHDSTVPQGIAGKPIPVWADASAPRPALSPIPPLVLGGSHGKSQPSHAMKLTLPTINWKALL